MEHLVTPLACMLTAGAWTHVGTHLPPTAEPGAFGHAVAWDGARLVVGPARDQDVGDGPPAVTFMRPGRGQGERIAVREPGGSRTAGFGLALAAARGASVVGSPHAGCDGRGCDTGQAHRARVDAAGPASLREVPCPGPEVASQFGAAVATDGRWIAVASPRADDGAVDAGRVDVYELVPARSGAGAPAGHRDELRHAATLRSPAPATSARFGASVAVDGGWLAVGEPGAGTGTPRAGLVHLHALREGRWTLQASLRAPAGAFGWHGAAVALAGADLLAGAPFARPHGADGPRCGAVTHWRLAGGEWRLRATVAPAPADAPMHGDGFGSAVALGDGWGFAGAPGDDLLGEDAGCAWAIDLRSARPERLLPEHAGAGDGFGAGLAWMPGPHPAVAVAGRADPERPPVPGAIELFGRAGPRPLRFTRTRRRSARSPCPRPPSPTRRSRR